MYPGIRAGLGITEEEGPTRERAGLTKGIQRKGKGKSYNTVALEGKRGDLHLVDLGRKD